MRMIFWLFLWFDILIISMICFSFCRYFIWVHFGLHPSGSSVYSLTSLQFVSFCWLKRLVFNHYFIIHFNKVLFLQLWTEFNMLVLNLLVTELIVASVGLPLEFVAATQFGWKMGETACKAFGFLLTFLGDLIYFWLRQGVQGVTMSVRQSTQ